MYGAPFMRTPGSYDKVDALVTTLAFQADRMRLSCSPAYSEMLELRNGSPHCDQSSGPHSTLLTRLCLSAIFSHNE